MKKLNELLSLFVLPVIFAATASAQANGAAADRGKPVVLIMGDSVMKTVSVSLERNLAQNGAFQPVSFASIGSGLCRLDLLDWHAKIKTLVENEKPSVAVMLIGSNDNQAMQAEHGGILQQGSDEWQAEYARRVAKCMDIMIEGGVKNVIWVSMPDMREPDRQEHALIINRIFSKEASSRPSVFVLDTQKIFSREPGSFTMYVLGPDGRPLYVRAQDGVHFNREGANRLAAVIITKMNELRE